MSEAYYFAGIALKASGQEENARKALDVAFRISPSYLGVGLTQFIQSGYYTGQSSDPFSPRVETALDACMADPKCLVPQ